MLDAKERKQNKIAGIELFLVACLSLLPTGGIYEYIKLAGVAVILVELLIRGALKLNNSLLTIIFIITFASSVALVFSVFSKSTDNSELMHELKRNGFLCGLIILSSNLKVDFKSIYRVCVFFILINTLIQVLEYMKVEAVFDFIETYYVTSGEESIHLELARYEGFLYFRAGSIFLNPNVYMVIPLVSMSVFLQHSILGRSWFNKLMIVVTCLSIFLTGSRTAVVITFALLIVYALCLQNRPALKVTFVAVALLILAAISKLADTYRIFDVSSGLDNSLGTKLTLLLEYFNVAGPISLIFGSLGIGNIGQIDFELGYIFAFYGILGVVWFALIVRSIKYESSVYTFITRALRIVLILMACTASVLLCMPICTFFLSIALAKPTVNVKAKADAV